MNHVISFLTWRCGLGCPYCGYATQPDNLSVKYRPAGRVFHVEREITGAKWVRLLSRFEPAVYDFCGGEATRHPGFRQITHSLDNWAVTSNTVGDIGGLDFHNCHSWTASYHPHAGPAARVKFLENLQLIRSYGVPVSVTLVAQLHTVDAVLSEAKRFDSMGYRVNIHPYYDEPGFTWQDHPIPWQKLMAVPKWTRYDTRLISWNDGGVAGAEKQCDGGRTYFTIAPDGRIFRCLWGMLSGLNEPVQGPEPDKWSCSARCHLPCDWVYALDDKRGM